MGRQAQGGPLRGWVTGMGAEPRSPDSLAVGLHNKHHSYVYVVDPAGYSPHCRLPREEDPPWPAVAGRIMKAGPVPGGGEDSLQWAAGKGPQQLPGAQKFCPRPSSVTQRLGEDTSSW